MNRRAMLAGLLGTSLGMAGLHRIGTEAQAPADLAGCLAEPGIALFLGIFQGQPLMQLEELMPRPDWQLFLSPSTTVSFLYPPDWTGQVLFASSFSPSGAPQWVGQQQSASGLTSARVVGPQGNAIWEYVIGSLLGVALTLEQAVAIAEAGVFGDGPSGTRLCAHTETVTGVGVSWLTAVERDGLVLMTNGTLSSDPAATVPYSVLTYYALGGPKAELEPLMRQVLIPIQWQMLRGGGFEPTPTPTP